MNDEQQELAALRSENTRLLHEMTNAKNDLARAQARSERKRGEMVATVVVTVIVGVLIYVLMQLWADAGRETAEKETQKNIACIEEGGIWDRGNTSGTCVWSQDR